MVMFLRHPVSGLTKVRDTVYLSTANTVAMKAYKTVSDSA